jgi:hypothetical protein
MMRGRKEKARQGKKTGGAAPLGYRNPPPGDPKRGVLQVVAEEAELVRRIFREIAAGAGLRSLAERLTAEGVPAPRGIRWGKTTIRRMLENRAYLGISANGVWRASADSSTFRLDVTHPEAILVEGAHEAIVSPAMWEAARAQLGGSSNGRPGMLTGFLWINGLRAGIDASRRSSYYRPADRQPGPWIPVETVNQAVWAGFANLFRDGTTVRRLFQAAHRVDLRDACASDLEALDRQKGKLEARLERLVEMRADGEISKADFAERSAAARRSLREVEEANRSARISTRRSSRASSFPFCRSSASRSDAQASRRSTRCAAWKSLRTVVPSRNRFAKPAQTAWLTVSTGIHGPGCRSAGR